MVPTQILQRSGSLAGRARQSVEATLNSAYRMNRIIADGSLERVDVDVSRSSAC